MLILRKKWNIIKYKNLFSYINIGKETLTFFGYWNWKKEDFTTIRLLLFKDVDIEKVLVSNKISFDEKTITSAYVKSYDGQLNGCIFWLNTYWKNIILLRVKSVLI